MQIFSLIVSLIGTIASIWSLWILLHSYKLIPKKYWEQFEKAVPELAEGFKNGWSRNKKEK